MQKCSRNRAKTGHLCRLPVLALAAGLLVLSTTLYGTALAARLQSSLSAEADPLARSTMGTTERLVINPTTGLALGGNDPVSYFVDPKPRPGSPDLEYGFSGGYWRFANEGNLAAFKADPDAYVPRYGGYGALAIAQGSIAPGNPEIYVVRGKRLYLFYTPTARTIWLMNADTFISQGEEHWPELKGTLAR